MNRIFLYGIGILLIVCGLMFARISHLENKVEKGKQFEALYKSSLQEAKVWKDKHDQWHSKAQDLEVSNSTLKEMIKAKDPDMVRLLSEVKDLKKNLSNLQSFNAVTTSTQTNFESSLKDSTGKDSVKVKEFDYRTKWDHYHGIIQRDTILIQRDGIDSLDVAVSFKKRWFLGKKTYSSEVVSGNPDTKITYNRAISVKRKKR